MKVKDSTTGRFKVGGVCGVGVYDINETTRSQGEAYKKWRGMLLRCYSEEYQIRQPTYIGCKVSKDWLYFSVFRGWFHDNYIHGWELDKDLIGDGKLYSENSCCFLPKRINLALPKQTKRGRLVGIRNNWKDTYTAQSTNEHGKSVHLGTFKSREDAFSAYANERTRVVRALAEIYKYQLNISVYFALRDFTFEKYTNKLGE